MTFISANRRFMYMGAIAKYKPISLMFITDVYMLTMILDIITNMDYLVIIHIFKSEPISYQIHKDYGSNVMNGKRDTFAKFLEDHYNNCQHTDVRTAELTGITRLI